MQSGTEFETLVQEIVAVNLAWKATQAMGSHLETVSHSLVDIKTRLQIRLLHQYAPERLYLELDADNQGDQGEDLYGLILRQPTVDFWNAAHLPVRIAVAILSPQEITKFSQKN